MDNSSGNVLNAFIFERLYMRRMIIKLLVVTTILLTGAVRGELLPVEDFNDKAEAITIDGKVPNGVLGGSWDTEGENSGNITTRASDGSMTLRVTSHSSGTLYRGGGISNLSNPIDETETGVLFFRFKAASGTSPLKDYFGMHTMTSSSFLVSSSCRASSINAGFGVSCESGSTTFDVITTDDATTLMTGLTRDQWYNVWIVANNVTDTFDLYINAVSAPGGAVELPLVSDLAGEDIPFGAATTAGLAGAMFVKPVQSPAIVSQNVHIDDLYWDGDAGLTLVSKAARNPVPANDEIQVPLDQILSWDAPDDPNVAEVLGYDVYLDPNELNVTAGLASVQRSSNQTARSYDPAGLLSFDQQLFWRVDARVRLDDPNQTLMAVPSKVWTFTCETSLPVITQQPADTVVAGGGTVMFVVTADSYFKPAYQWYKSIDGAANTPADDTLIAGATATTLTLWNVSEADEGFYFCRVSNPSVAYSDVAALGIKRELAHWTLDELTGGQYADSSGNGHHADPNGSAAFIDGANPTATGNAAVIDMTNGWADAGTWNPSEYTGQLTLSLWVKWAGQWETPNYQGLIGKRNTYTDDGMMWQLEIGNGSPYNLTFKRHATGTQAVATTGPLAVGEWEQVVVTYDGSTAVVYRNGQSAASAEMPLSDGTAATLMIGAVGLDLTTGSAISPMNGLLDDIRIYNYALDPVTIAYSYTDIKGGTICTDPANPVLQTFDHNDNCRIDVGDLVEMADHWLYNQLVP